MNQQIVSFVILQYNERIKDGGMGKHSYLSVQRDPCQSLEGASRLPFQFPGWFLLYVLVRF